MHLHWICVFCHFKLCFGRCPQPLTVAGLCGNQPAISNKLFNPLSNITFRNVRTRSFPVRQAANCELPSDARGNWTCAEQVSPFCSAGFQNGVVDLLRLRFQSLTIFLIRQVKTFPIQPCLQGAKGICFIQKPLQRCNMIFLHNAAEHGRMQVQRVFPISHRVTMTAVQWHFFNLPACVAEQLPRVRAECKPCSIVRSALRVCAADRNSNLAVCHLCIVLSLVSQSCHRFQTKAIHQM